MLCNVQNNAKFFWMMWIPCICLTRKRFADDKTSTKTVTVEVTGEKDEKVTTDQWPNYSLDTSVEEDLDAINA